MSFNVGFQDLSGFLIVLLKYDLINLLSEFFLYCNTVSFPGILPNVRGQNMAVGNSAIK